MSTVRSFSAARERGLTEGPPSDAPFDSVVVLVTDPVATLRAVGVADRLARAINADVTVLAVQSPVPQPKGGEARSPQEAEISLLHARIRAMGRMRFRVVVARTALEGLARVLRPESLVVVGGRRRRWWPMTTERLCRAIEALGHYVLFVDEAHHAA